MERNKDPDKAMDGLMPIWEHGFKNREDYKGLWTEETLAHEVDEYFRYCFNNEVKVAKVGLQLWLGMSKAQYYEWASNPKHGFKTDIIRQANDLIELSYMGRVESYPTGNIFLLKSLHGVNDTTKVEITNNGASKEDVKDLVSKLGLDEKSEKSE